ncbi:MAG: hypothetical protein LQ342_002942 [Letrouitia transgressa]|nr:MAG: hypothetical protein LQ342_002942 [Letrouitia transgressa]
MPELLWNSAVSATYSKAVRPLTSYLRSAPEGKDNDEANSKTYTIYRGTMRRIFGPNKPSFLSTIQANKSLSQTVAALQARSTSGPPGLGNWDNSCYQNSVIQGLASLPSFSDFLQSSSLAQAAGSTRAALIGIIGKLNDPGNAGSMLWIPVELKNMSSWQQQDAQEYFSKILDTVEKESVSFEGHDPVSRGLSSLAKPSLQSIESSSTSEESKEHPIEEKLALKSSRNISQLSKELQPAKMKNPLEGLLAQRVGCLQCGHVEGLSLIPFNCLTVPLGKQWMYDVRTCLDDYTALETINDVECVRCTLLERRLKLKSLLQQIIETNRDELQSPAPIVTEALRVSVEEQLQVVNEVLNDNDYSDNMIFKRCQIPTRGKISTAKSRQAVIARAPKSLVIHINRSVFDESTGFLSKNFAAVRFPLRFNLASWCLGSSSATDGDGSDIEHWNTDPAKSLLPNDEADDETAREEIYELCAVLTHHGRHENGHYICYRKYRTRLKTSSAEEDDSEGSWWRFSDEDVSRVSEEDVLSQDGAFMLFYEKAEIPRVDPRDNEYISGAANSTESLASDAKTQAEQPAMDKDATTTLGDDEGDIARSRPSVPAEPTVMLPSIGAKEEVPGTATGKLDCKSTATEIQSTTDTKSALEGSLENASNSSIMTAVTDSLANSTFTKIEKPVDLDPQLLYIQPQRDSAQKENRNYASAMRTATPRNSRGSMSRSKAGMEQVSSMVTSH